ncbi:MAG: flippase-like domain-containing protein [Bacteroidales bacterium]|nr:flippase-like domain-containing protein [Bacteroidales bacterium]
MDKKVSNILKYALWIGVAVMLLFFSFRGVDWKDFGMALRGCRWEYVILSMFLGALVFYVRGLRWRMQLLPIDPSTRSLTCFNAYNICMLVNLVLPRVGEVVRCGYITKNSARDGEGRRLATMDKVIGTVLVDRLWDAVSLVLVLVVLLSLMWDKFGAFFTQNIFTGLSGRVNLGWVLAFLAVSAAGFIWLCRCLRDRGRIWGRVWGFISGIGEGLATCLHMERGWLFIFYTVVIWCLYWLMSACIMWSLQGIDPARMSPELAEALVKIDSLTMVDALFLMFAGALSSVVPVPGGFGAFHTVVAGALVSIYGIPFGLGLIFATLSHESQVITDAVCGACSYAYEALHKS